MNIKKEIKRLDIVSRTMMDRSNLIRVVKTNKNQIVIDLDNKCNGRGAYLFKDKSSIELAKKRNLIAKALRCKIDDAIYEELLRILEN